MACLCHNLVSVHFYAIPILHFKFPKFFRDMLGIAYQWTETRLGHQRAIYIIIVLCVGESKAPPVLYPSYSTVYVEARAQYSPARDNGDSFSLSLHKKQGR